MGKHAPWRWVAMVALVSSGCSLAPKRFEDRLAPEPIVRARALSLGDALPLESVAPGLIEQLDDPDPVVRLTAHEELKRRTGKDFGYKPWADQADRLRTQAMWLAWFQSNPARESVTANATRSSSP